MRRSTVGIAKVGNVGLLGAAIALAGSGCGRLDSSEFEGATPTKDTVALVVPASGAATAAATNGDTTVRQGALLGKTAKDYQLTATLALVVNAATGAVLGLVKSVTNYPATSVSGDTAVWGPSTDPLSANTYRLTVTRQAPQVFAWKLDGKGKTADDSAFVTVLSGVHTRAVDANGDPMEGFGSGNFLIDWDAAATLPQHDQNVGQMAFTYARQSPTAQVTNDVTFTNIFDNCDPSTCSTHGQIFDATYAYAATPGAGGDLQYGATENFVTTSAADETLSLHSRWQETGAGRTDVQLTGGDLAATVDTSSECWDSNFFSVYSAASYDPADPAVDWGMESSCAFASAAFVSLSP
ncbi:MAG TPA: hypothetical protein VHO06_02530 [Polyangia bacterium]|nr:hypothetical protein [Polyangia bacterium]